ncbi:MAG TPA: hypothetical protein VLO30_01655 [Chthoniobacterales bacterium]|nr:hypothetical protein [Chthoniobacterales bacterium]
MVFPNGSWTAGAPAPGQTVSQVFPTITPNLTISLNNNGASAQGMTWAPGYATINSTQTTGGFAGQNGLQLYATASSSTTAYILTTITFASPVTNVSFQLWDVDKAAGQFADTISAIQALSSTGTVQAASSVTSAVAGFNTITGSGLGIVVNGTAGASNTTNQGTIDISFAGPITQFSFRWSNSDTGLGAQAIGVGNINFTAVPEPNSLWGLVGLLGIVATHRAFATSQARNQRVKPSAARAPGPHDVIKATT